MHDTGAPISLECLFGAVLRAYRKGGLRETAAKIPLNFSHLAKWERGERPVPAAMVPLLDQAYAANGALITLHELITRDRLRSAVLTAAIGWMMPCAARSGDRGETHRQGERPLFHADTRELLTVLEELTAGVRAVVAERDGIEAEQ